MTYSHHQINNIADRMMARMDALGDEAIQAMRNTPEAKARQAEWFAQLAASHERAAKRQIKAKAAAVAANNFQAGDVVNHKRGMFAGVTVVSVEGANVALSNGKKFAASMLVAA